MNFRSPRIKSEAHLAFVRTLPCTWCGDDTSTEAAHVRFGDDRAAKRPTGKGEKPHDRWAIPLCGKCHREQHTMSERKWWDEKGIDPIFICLALWAESGNHQAGEIIVRAWK